MGVALGNVFSCAMLKFYLRSKMALQHNTLRNSNCTADEETFILKEVVQFGFHSVCSSQIQIAENGKEADKKDPSLHYAYGVAYGARPLRGNAEFEVEVTSYGTEGRSGTLKLGVMRWAKGRPLTAKDVPRYSPEGTDYCVWSANKIHNRLRGQSVSVEKIYGRTTLPHASIPHASIPHASIPHASIPHANLFSRSIFLYMSMASW